MLAAEKSLQIPAGRAAARRALRAAHLAIAPHLPVDPKQPVNRACASWLALMCASFRTPEQWQGRTEYESGEVYHASVQVYRAVLVHTVGRSQGFYQLSN